MKSSKNSTRSGKIRIRNIETIDEVSSGEEGRLGKTLVIGTCILFFMAVLVLSWFTLERIEAQTRADIAGSLKSVLRTTQGALHIWEFERKVDAFTWALSKELQAAVDDLLKVPRTREALMNAPAQARLRTLIAPATWAYDDLGFFIIDPDLISIGSMRDSNLGSTNLLAAQGKILERVFAGESLISHPMISDVPLLNAAGHLVDGEPTMFVVTPIFDEKNKVKAALAFRLNPARNFTRILQLGRTGETGETYAFDNRGTLLSESRFDRHLHKVGLIAPGRGEILSFDIRDPGGNLLEGYKPGMPHKKQPLTVMANIAVSGQAGVDVDGYRNYLGDRVVGAWTWEPGLEFALVTEINAEEAYRSFNLIRRLTLFAVGLTGLMAIGVTLFIRDITQRRANEKAEAEVEYREELKRLVRERTDELRNANEKLEVFAKTDPLTGLPNRRGMKEKIDYEKIRFQRSRQTFSCLLADIDDFKEINDTYGHEAGDSILVQVAEVFMQNSREQDIVCRWGGEEFVALLPETDLEGGRILAEKFRSKIEEKRFQFQKQIIPLTLSFGVSVYREGDREINACIKRADECLYKAKQAGKNRVVAHLKGVNSGTELIQT